MLRNDPAFWPAFLSYECNLKKTDPETALEAALLTFLSEKAGACGCVGWECECGGFAARVLLDLLDMEISDEKDK